MTNTYIKNLDSHIVPFKQEAERLVNDFRYRAYLDASKVVRWTSNDRVPPTEILDLWKHVGYDFNYELSLQVQQQDNEQAIARYKQAQANRKPSQEERYEMESAFGKGTTVVDVITGKRTKL